MRISDVFVMGGGHDDGTVDPFYIDPYACYSSEHYCERLTGPFNYPARGDRQGLAHILGSPKDGGGLLGIFRRS